MQLGQMCSKSTEEQREKDKESEERKWKKVSERSDVS